MPRPASTPLLHRFVRSVAARDAPDAELLARSAAGDGEAFEALVRRHGPMVLDVCRSVLRNDADADDVFQATFLVLARSAGLTLPTTRGDR